MQQRYRPATVALIGLTLLLLACGGRRSAGVRIVLAPPATPVAFARAALTGPGVQPLDHQVGITLGAGVPADLLQRPAAQVLSPASPGDLTVQIARAGAGEGFIARYWVPVTDLFNDATGISSGDLRRVLAGEVRDWRELGASPAPVQVLLPADHLDELRALLGAFPDTTPEPAATASVQPAGIGTPRSRPPGFVSLPSAGLPARLELQRGALALRPLEEVDERARALALDGIDLFRGVGDASTYPLVTRLTAAGGAGSNAEAASTVRAALAARLPDTERVLATGDIIPARCVFARERAFNDYTHSFQLVAPTLRSADLAIGSLDASISDKGVPIGCVETFSLMAPPQSIDGMVYAGIGLLTIAANHAKDCGESACGDDAFLDTMARLSSAGIAYTGGGRNLQEARTARVLTVKGVRFAFLGYDDIASQYYGAGPHSPGTAPLDLSTLAADVKAAKARADVVVVMVHWGTEYVPDPTDRQRQAAGIAVQAGAALVVGNHPHVVQAVEAFAGGFADYALGNFVFDQDWSQETLEGVVMETIFDGPRLVQVAFLPLMIQDMNQPHFVGQAQGRRILSRMHDASARLTH